MQLTRSSKVTISGHSLNNTAHHDDPPAPASPPYSYRARRTNTANRRLCTLQTTHVNKARNDRFTWLNTTGPLQAPRDA
eukprot:1180803-Prorocentrum_minimum.AAC.2